MVLTPTQYHVADPDINKFVGLQELTTVLRTSTGTPLKKQIRYTKYPTTINFGDPLAQSHNSLYQPLLRQHLHLPPP